MHFPYCFIFGGEGYSSYYENVYDLHGVVSCSFHAHDHVLVCILAFIHEMWWHSLKGMTLNRSNETNEFLTKAHYSLQ